MLQICNDLQQTGALQIIRKFSNYTQHNQALCNSRCNLRVVWTRLKNVLSLRGFEPEASNPRLRTRGFMPPLVRPCFVRTKSSIHEKYEKWAKIPEMLTRSKLSSVVKIKLTEDAVWADWAIYCTLGNFSKPVATIILSKWPTFLGNFWKGVKIFHFSSEIILGNFHWCIWRLFTGHTECNAPKVPTYLGANVVPETTVYLDRLSINYPPHFWCIS